MPLRYNWPTRSRRAVWTLALVIAALITGALAAEDEAYLVVVSPDVTITDISLDDLRRIFLFKQRFWRPNLPITLLYSESSLKADSMLLQRVYLMEQPLLKRLILQRLYSGEIDLAPKVVATDEAVASFVGSGQGLIAVIRADAVGNGPARVLTIDGKSPASADYPLRR
jgi:hypothetical protein